MNPKSTTPALAIATLMMTACSESPPESAAVVNSQTVSTGAWTQPMTSWGDPDLQGMWPIAHLIATPFQRPEQYGERLYFNEDELAAQRSRVEARNTRYEKEDASDRIGMGHWAEPSDMPTQTSLIVDPPDGRFPEMTEQGKQMSLTLGSSWGREDFDSPKDFDVWDRCITRGLPVSMFPFNYNNGIEIVQSPGYVVINMEMIHEARVIPVDGRPPLDPAIQQWLGESRGHWEGNTLVVETTNFNGIPGMTNVGITGSPQGNYATSTELRLVERLERVSDKQINYQITVEDPVTLTRSWTAAFPWRRDDSYQFFEYACNEDNYAIRDFITTSRYRRAQEAGEL
ncbi:MAG: hypothetical protein RQ899_14130 [Pseudomonadales bacterium]|nr:hypothetical protein [Pseudomonadales bacterium]